MADTRPSACSGLKTFAVVLAAAASIFLTLPSPVRAGAEDRLVVGLKAFRDGFHDLAAKELRAFLEASPGDPRRADVLYVLAQAEIARENWPGAREPLEELAKGGGDRAREGQYWLGWVALKQGKKVEAARDLDRYLAEPGGDRRADALYLAADLSREAGDPAGAAKRLGDFLRENPGDSRRGAAWAGWVDALLASEQAAPARDAAKSALADPAVTASPDVLERVALRGAEASRKANDPGGEVRFWSVLAQGAKSQALRDRARYREDNRKFRD